VFLNAGDTPAPGRGWHYVSGQALETVDTTPAWDDGGQEPVRLAAGHLLPAHTDFRNRKISLESFSSIAHRMVQSRDGVDRPASFRLVDAPRREDDEPLAIIPTESRAPDPSDELPGGTRMGSMFHHIFEHIDFQSVVDGPADILAEDGARLVVESALALYRIEPRWAPRIARMVSAALRTAINADGAPLLLGRLLPGQRRHEMEFYFPLVEPLPETMRIPGCTLSGDPCGEMVIRGFIDLVFSWQGRYYIADWKSNRLGEGYDPSAMAREMASAGYELQYQLYTIATLRWLKRQLGDRFDPHRHFGGAFYLFIRGMGKGGQDGIFHITPEQLLPLETLQETIQRQIAGLQ
jgi:exodeoxyribonuclease V beta subunit